MRAGRSLRIFSGVSAPPAALASLAKITEATRPLNCWYTIDLTRVSNPGSRNWIP